MSWNIFQSIEDKIDAVWSAAKSIIQGIYNRLLDGWAWLVGLILLLVAAVHTVTAFIVSLLSRLVGYLASMVLPQSDLTGYTSLVSDSLGFFNMFFPLSEMFSILVVLSTLWLVCLLYRFVKSWIPTVN